MKQKNKELMNLIALAVLMAVLVFATVLVYKVFGHQAQDLFNLVRQGDEEAMAAYLSSQSQAAGYFTLFILCVLQVATIFFPGMVIQITGALIYGWSKAFAICFAGIVAGNALIFFIGRTFGKVFESFLSEEKQKDNWFSKQLKGSHAKFAVAIAFLIPGVPNGIIPYLAAGTKMHLKDYVEAVAGSAWVGVLLMCLAGHFIRSGNYAFTILTFAIQVALIVILTKNRDKILK